MDTPELHPGAPGQTSTGLTVRGDTGRRLISAAEFQQLADVPAAADEPVRRSGGRSAEHPDKGSGHGRGELARSP